MATLFFSYSHKDEALRDELEVHLAMLKRQKLIESWHDRRILAGDGVDENIDANLEAADIMLLLVSPDFLASRYCYDVEVKRAMERNQAGKCRVIPVILRPCDWKDAPFAGLLAAPKDGKPVTMWANRDEAFLDVIQHIKEALPRVRLNTATEVASVPAHHPPAGPRSSNLRLRKQFTEVDRDRFLDETFDYIARFFEGSLAELQERNPGIEGRFARIDSRAFNAVIYRNGKAMSRCGIGRGGAIGFRDSITFSFDDNPSANSFNESLSVGADEQSLFLKPMGLAFASNTKPASHLSQEGAAEFYWSLFIEPLQRR